MSTESEMQNIPTVYMTVDTSLPAYLPYPVFLLDMKISMTAKAVYALLARRSNLSKANGWEDELGRVYIIYPIDAIAADIHKSKTTVKTVMKELENSGLLERHHQSTGRANRLYVKLPKQDGAESPRENSRIQNPTYRKQSVSCGRNQTLCRSGNSPPDGRISGHDKGRNPAPSKKKQIQDNNINNDDMVRSDYGRYGNLFLSDDEYSALAADYPDDLSRYLEELSCYLAATGRTYRNYEAGIRSWALRDHSRTKADTHKAYEYTEEDTL